MSSERWLSEDAKAKVLADWAETQRTPVPDHVKGGEGYPDAEIVPWCDRLNEITGLVTLQSCAGHRRDEYTYPGNLWLWLSEGMAKAFYAGAFGLAGEPWMERAETIYLNGREIVSLTFHGAERDRLEWSMRGIFAFFTALARQVNRRATPTDSAEPQCRMAKVAGSLNSYPPTIRCDLPDGHEGPHVGTLTLRWETGDKHEAEVIATARLNRETGEVEYGKP